MSKEKDIHAICSQLKVAPSHPRLIELFMEANEAKDIELIREFHRLYDYARSWNNAFQYETEYGTISYQKRHVLSAGWGLNNFTNDKAVLLSVSDAECSDLRLSPSILRVNGQPVSVKGAEYFAFLVMEWLNYGE